MKTYADAVGYDYAITTPKLLSDVQSKRISPAKRVNTTLGTILRNFGFNMQLIDRIQIVDNLGDDLYLLNYYIDQVPTIESSQFRGMLVDLQRGFIVCSGSTYTEECREWTFENDDIVCTLNNGHKETFKLRKAENVIHDNIIKQLNNQKYVEPTGAEPTGAEPTGAQPTGVVEKQRYTTTTVGNEIVTQDATNGEIQRMIFVPPNVSTVSKADVVGINAIFNNNQYNGLETFARYYSEGTVLQFYRHNRVTRFCTHNNVRNPRSAFFGTPAKPFIDTFEEIVGTDWYDKMYPSDCDYSPYCYRFLVTSKSSLRATRIRTLTGYLTFLGVQRTWQDVPASIIGNKIDDRSIEEVLNLKKIFEGIAIKESPYDVMQKCIFYPKSSYTQTDIEKVTTTGLMPLEYSQEDPLRHSEAVILTKFVLIDDKRYQFSVKLIPPSYDVRLTHTQSPSLAVGLYAFMSLCINAKKLNTLDKILPDKLGDLNYDALPSTKKDRNTPNVLDVRTWKSNNNDLYARSTFYYMWLCHPLKHNDVIHAYTNIETYIQSIANYIYDGHDPSNILNDKVRIKLNSCRSEYGYSTNKDCQVARNIVTKECTPLDMYKIYCEISDKVKKVVRPADRPINKRNKK